MKTTFYKLFSFIIGSAFSFSVIAQSDTGSAIPFKEIYKTQEGDQHLEIEIKKKELQQAPSQIIVTNDSSALKKTKKHKCRKKKKSGI